MGLISRFQQIYNKLLFCARVAAGPGTFVRLLVNSKRLNRYQRKGGAVATGDAAAAADAVAYRIRYLSRDWTLYLRTYAGDIRIFYEIFLERIYQLPVSVIRDPMVIVDAGANIGMAGVYFRSVYAGARIYCIEPDAGNVEILSRNLAGPLKEGSVILTEAALHDREGMVNLSGDGWAYNYSVKDIDEDGLADRVRGADTVPGAGGGSVAGGGAGAIVPAITPAGFIAKFGLERIDLLKMDIEGAEEGLFRGDIAWLDRVGVLLIEIHTEEGKTLIRERLEERGFEVRAAGLEDERRAPGVNASLFLAYRK
jgi:FkbM family methyltransferase